MRIYKTMMLALSLALATATGVAKDKKDPDAFDKAGKSTKNAIKKGGDGADKGMKKAGDGLEAGIDGAGVGVGAAVEHGSRGATVAGKKTAGAAKTTGKAIAGFFGADDPGSESERADRVRKAQKKLRSKGYYSGEIDGIPGPQTEASLRRFQAEKGLETTGLLDAKTAKKLGL